MKLKKVFTQAMIRDLEQAVFQGQITSSRSLEIMNHLAWCAYVNNTSQRMLHREFTDALYGVDKTTFDVEAMKIQDDKLFDAIKNKSNIP